MFLSHSRLSRAGSAVTREPAAYVTALLAVLLAVAGGCRSDESSPPPPPSGETSPIVTTAASPTPSADPVEAARRAALDAYRGMWDAFLEALRIPDPDHPSLVEFAVDDALRVLVAGVESAERDGLAGRGEVVLDPEVSGLEPASSPIQAEIVDCVDDSGAELYRIDGEPYVDPPGGLRHAEATVRDLGRGAWKVVGFALYEVGTCNE